MQESAISYLNLFYKQAYHQGKDLISLKGTETDLPADIIWFRKGIKTDYDVILDIRNECAVASLALHKWDLYVYNNKIFILNYLKKCLQIEVWLNIVLQCSVRKQIK